MGRKRKRSAVREQAGGPAEQAKARPDAAASYGRGEAALFSLTLFLSAALLFTVQPMFAKMVLPLLGGVPAVWNACLVFYQAALLAGYLYAHLSLAWLGPRRQAVLHLALLGLAWLALPIHVAQGWLPPATTFPAPWLWMLLAVSLGLPFLAVSASAPMLQAWFARTRGPAGRDPYFLYAASNLGSLLALLAYPLVIEAQATLARQSGGWAIGYGLLMALVAACAVTLWRTPVEIAENAPSPPGHHAQQGRLPSCRVRQAGEGRKQPSPAADDSQGARRVFDRPAIRRRLRWLALSLVPSSLLLGVTTYISSDIAPMPFLWVVPLALYLLTFVLVFAPRTILPLRWMVRLQPFLIVAAVVTLLCNGAALREVLLFGSLHLATFFVTAMVCHGQLAAERPEPSQLTEFYLWMSLGGVVGGLFSALVAPVVFNSVLEYPLMMAVACLLRPRQGSRHSPNAVRPAAGTGHHVPMAAVGVPLAEGPGLPQGEPAARTTRRTAHGVYLLLWGRERFLLPATALLFCLIVAWGLRSGSFLSGWRFTDTAVMRILTVGLAAFATFLLRRRPAVFGTAVAALAAISLWSVETGTRLLDAKRSFYGILRVEHDPIWNTNQLLHGTTNHGLQSLVESQRHEAQGYYHRTGPLGGIFELFKTSPAPLRKGEGSNEPRRSLAEVGVLGLGVGTIAAYAEPGQRFTFYEIDPAVERIARNTDYFTYLADCRGTAEVILGDARLSLEHGPERKFDLLIVDVFSSDSVPVHLMTREAFKIYQDRLNPRGVLALHISSRYLDLELTLGKLAEDAGLTARLWRDVDAAGVVGRFVSVWVVMAKNPADLGSLATDPRWQPLARDPGPVWTDDFSNVAGTLKWKSSGLHLFPWRWQKAKQAEGHALLALALLDEHRIDEAIEHFQKSLEIEPDNAPNHYGLGVVLASRGRLDEAIEHYEEALSLDPNLAKAHSDLGIALDRKGKTDEALEHFRRAVEINPGYVDGLRNLGKALLDRQQYDEGVTCFHKAVAIQPGSAEIRFDLGLALKQHGKIDAALGELRQALPLAEAEKNNAELVEKIKAEIRRCEAWPWDEETKK